MTVLPKKEGNLCNKNCESFKGGWMRCCLWPLESDVGHSLVLTLLPEVGRQDFWELFLMSVWCGGGSREGIVLFSKCSGRDLHATQLCCTHFATWPQYLHFVCIMETITAQSLLHGTQIVIDGCLMRLSDLWGLMINAKYGTLILVNVFPDLNSRLWLSSQFILCLTHIYINIGNVSLIVPYK